MCAIPISLITVYCRLAGEKKICALFGNHRRWPDKIFMCVSIRIYFCMMLKL